MLKQSKQQNRKGVLFAHKTKAKMLNEAKNDYLLSCFMYIHQNPYLAKLVDKIEDWIQAVENFDLSSYDREKAKKYVLENHSADKLYDLIFGEFRDNAGKDYTQKKILNIPDIQEVAVVTSSIADTDEW